ncbi:MFS transporter [Streptomyces tricolor]|nr:MFS transporter [Streptomyces tricolor]
MNLARAVGPALGGVVVAAMGAGWVFAFNALSYLGIAAVLLLWRRPVTPRPTARGEGLLAAVQAGRHLCPARSPASAGVLLRTAAFVPGGAALWSLASLVASRPWDSARTGTGSCLVSWVPVR